MTSRHEIEHLPVFAPIADTGRAGMVAQRLADAIVLGVLADGDQLPSEASLGRQFGVAAVTAREALEVLRSRGLLRTKRGRGGGSFVTFDRARTGALDMTRLASVSRHELRDMAIHHCAISAKAAALAAERASDEDVERLREILAEIDDDDPVATRRGEALIRLEIAAVARSGRLLTEEVRLQSEYGPLLWAGCEDVACRRQLRVLHYATVSAIESVDTRRAADLVTEQFELLVRHAIRMKTRIDRETDE